MSASAAQFLRFGVVGILGLGVDTAALYFAKDVLGLGLYGGRVFSYLVAATFTWAANRRYTFTQADTTHPIQQWGKFLAANAVGGVVNYAVYAAVVTFWPLAAAYPVIAIAAGSLSGMTFNFVASKRWVFKS